MLDKKTMVHVGDAMLGKAKDSFMKAARKFYAEYLDLNGKFIAQEFNDLPQDYRESFVITLLSNEFYDAMQRDHLKLPAKMLRQAGFPEDFVESTLGLIVMLGLTFMVSWDIVDVLEQIREKGHVHTRQHDPER